LESPARKAGFFFALKVPKAGWQIFTDSVPLRQNIMETFYTDVFLHELESESAATRKCLERITPEFYDYKPHPTSMTMGYLALLVAEIPLWIAHMITKGEIDLATFPHPAMGSTSLVDYFNDNIEQAGTALKSIYDDELEENFFLKSDGRILYTTTKRADIATTLNHWVHHRGQLTVYMRMNEIPVPALYGPSADDKNFQIPS
jgi:uncharacterized damage-inducible protein DinB